MEISNQEFDEMLEEILDGVTSSELMAVPGAYKVLEEILNGVTSSELMAVPGAYEVLSEHYNNEVLDRITERRAEDEEENENDD